MAQEYEDIYVVDPYEELIINDCASDVSTMSLGVASTIKLGSELGSAYDPVGSDLEAP